MATITSLKQLLPEEQTKKGTVTTKRGSTKLYVDFYYHGVRVVKSSGLDDAPANRLKVQKWLDRVMEKIRDGSFVFAEAFPGAKSEEKGFHAQREGWDYRPQPQDILVGAYAQRYKEQVLPTFRSHGKRGDFEEDIDCWILPLFGEMTFYQLSGATIERSLARFVKRTGSGAVVPLSASRIRNILIPLRAIWNAGCEEYRWVLPSPFEYLRNKLPSRGNEAPKVFRFDEWKELMAAFDPYYLPVAEAKLMTGMIGSELAGLRKEAVKPNYLDICNSMVRGWEKDTLKTPYRKRKLPVTRALRQRLEQIMERAQGEYLFTMKSGRSFDPDSFRKNPWTRAFKTSGLSYKVPYSTRHTFAAWALTIGMPPLRLASLMGHGSKQMVYEVYGRYVEALEKDAGKILDYFGGDFLEPDRDTKPRPITHYGESTGESPAPFSEQVNKITKQRLVEAGGIEPPSGNLPLELLHA